MGQESFGKFNFSALCHRELEVSKAEDNTGKPGTRRFSTVVTGLDRALFIYVNVVLFLV